MLDIPNDNKHPLAERFVQFIGGADFPCVGAKAAVNRDGISFVVARDFGSGWDDLRIMPGLLDLARRYRADPVPFQSLVVLFENGAPGDEQAFETQLWARLQSLTDKDQWLGAARRSAGRARSRRPAFRDELRRRGVFRGRAASQV